MATTARSGANGLVIHVDFRLLKRINGRMATLKQDMLHARRSAEENNMPETIVRCFKFERHALKTEKEIEQLGRK